MRVTAVITDFRPLLDLQQQSDKLTLQEKLGYAQNYTSCKTLLSEALEGSTFGYETPILYMRCFYKCSIRW